MAAPTNPVWARRFEVLRRGADGTEQLCSECPCTPTNPVWARRFEVLRRGADVAWPGVRRVAATTATTATTTATASMVDL
jgi:hypothetical protein